MKNDCGSPAFENIDDILAEKIVAHSIRHTGEAEPSAPGAINESQMTTNTPVQRSLLLRIVAVSVAAVLLIVLFSVLINRKIHRADLLGTATDRKCK
jgi:hypothetical protein